MICFNCLKCILPHDLAVIEFKDRDGSSLIKKGICTDCGYKLALYLLDLERKSEEKTFDGISIYNAKND